MAAGNEKSKADAAPVHPWDLPAEEEFEDDGPRTIIARQPGPPEPPEPKPKSGEVLESMMPEPDPMGGPATLPGSAPMTLPGNTSAAPEPPPLTAFDSEPQPVFDPPTFADRPSAKIPRSGLHATEPNPLPPVTPSERVPEGTQPQVAKPKEPPPKKASTEAPAAGTPIRRATGELGKAAEAVRKQTPSGASAPRRTTGEIKSAQAVRRASGEIKSAQAVRRTTGEVKSAEQLRKATSKPSSRIPGLGEGDPETTRKKVPEKPAGALGEGEPETTRKKVPERLPPPVEEVASDEFEALPDSEDPELEASTAERQAVSKPGAFSRRRSREEREPTAPSANLGDPDLFERTKTGVKVMDPRAKKRLHVLVAVAVVLLGAFLLHGLYQGTREQPTTADLHSCYPYGFGGLRGPHGEDAPGAEFMQYEYLDEAACTTHPVCLRYRYSGQNRFTGTMVVGKAPAGNWERVGDEGSPFPPPRTRD
ncbi:MAG TPA: hypothetical protein VGK67_39965 [Myxococcales bacterium]